MYDLNVRYEPYFHTQRVLATSLFVNCCEISVPVWAIIQSMMECKVLSVLDGASTSLDEQSEDDTDTSKVRATAKRCCRLIGNEDVQSVPKQNRC